jgi:protein-S-isoprenylcysteine O-methyltransferase Ste14
MLPRNWQIPEYYTIMKNAMVLNSCILMGFLLLFAADFLRVRRSFRAATALDRIGYTFVFLAILHFAFAARASWPFGNREADLGIQGVTGIPAVLLWTGAASSALLLLWSVFFEFLWIRKKRGLGPDATVDAGTYGICRHPGFWWLSFLVVFIGILRDLKSHLVPVILLIGLDFLLVLLQDQYVFPRVFPGYKQYREKVPFLIPRKGGRN